MTVAYIAPRGKFVVTVPGADGAEVPLSGGKVHTYISGTTTNLATSKDRNGVASNTNPVILDVNGEADIWLGTSAYTFYITDSADVPISGATINDIHGPEEAGGVLIALADSTSTTQGDALIAVKQPFASTVARTQHDKNQVIIEALDWGIKGDGVTDDTGAWNNLLGALQPGWTVNLNALTISTNSNTATPMSGKDDVIFEGQGATLKMRNPDWTSEPFILYMVNCNRNIFRNIKWDGQITTSTGTMRRAVWLKSGNDNTFENCDFSKCYGGVYTGNGYSASPQCERTILRRCRSIAELTYTAARETNAQIPRAIADFTYGGDNSIVEDCYTIGLSIPVYSEQGLGVKVLGNTFLDGWNSQVYLKGPGAMVIGNYIRNAGKDAIKAIIGSTVPGSVPYRTVIANNYIDKFAMVQTDGSCGIHVQGRYHTVTGNLIFTPTHAEAAGVGGLVGIVVGGQDITVNGNTIIGGEIGSYTSGVTVWPSNTEDVTRINIVGNTIYNVKYGIQLRSNTSTYTSLDRISILGNNVSDGGCAVFVTGGITVGSGCQLKNLVVSNNVFNGLLDYATSYANCTSATISNNTYISCAAGQPIKIDGGVNYTVTNNTSDASYASGLIVELNSPTYRLRNLNYNGAVAQEPFSMGDNLTAPTVDTAGRLYIYADVADGDLKVRFADGTVKTIVVDT